MEEEKIYIYGRGTGEEVAAGGGEIPTVTAFAAYWMNGEGIATGGSSHKTRPGIRSAGEDEDWVHRHQPQISRRRRSTGLLTCTGVNILFFSFGGGAGW